MDTHGFKAIGATTYLCPTPTVMVGCASDAIWQAGGNARANLITVAWAGICCSKPPMLSIGIRPERYSHSLITQSGEFTVNLVGQALLYAMDFCGVKSGRDLDKFETLGLTALPAQGLSIAPALAQSPAYLSCKLRQTVSLGSHDLFIGEIVDVCVQHQFFLPDGSIDESAMELVSFVHGKYRATGDELGFFGYSVASEAALQRRMPSLAKQHIPKRAQGKLHSAAKPKSK
jgi:flavin reductase (DIM6/NTAB) family NADH-FMN oxidoreductase RutF